MVYIRVLTTTTPWLGLNQHPIAIQYIEEKMNQVILHVHNMHGINTCSRPEYAWHLMSRMRLQITRKQFEKLASTSHDFCKVVTLAFIKFPLLFETIKR